jgi:site-specific recombinase XerD
MSSPEPKETHHMAQIDDTIATYLTAIEVEGKTQNTVLSYRASLEDFRRVGGRLGFPQELEAYSIEHVYRFLGDLKERGASPAYRHRRHREVKTFFSWCRRMDYVADNVFAKVPLVRLEQQIRPPFSPDEIQRLLGSLDRTNLPGCRNHALILFLLDTGVRVSECVSIRLDDVDWERRRVLVRETKNKHDRWVGFGERTAQAMRDYVERFRGDRSGELFLTAAGEPMASGNTVRVILRRIAEQLGLAKVHPHRFRHTFATWAIQSGAREIDVQMLLGHSDLAMVQRYSRTYTSEQAVRAHARLSPVGQLESVGVEGDATEHPVPPSGAGPAEDQTLDLLSSLNGVSDVVPQATADAPPPRKDDSMATTKEKIRGGQTLVAKYKKQQYTCEVVEHDGRLCFVLPKGRVFKSPSAAGKAVTGTATNGYRFWSIPDQPPAGQAARQQAAQAAAEKAA